MRFRDRLPKIRSPWRPGHAWIAVPFLLIVGVGEGEMVFPEPVHLRSLLMVAPALAARVAGPLLTGALALLALGAHLGLRVVQPDESLVNDDLELVALLVVSGLSLGFCVSRHRHQAALERVRSVSEAAQRVVLRPLPPRVGPLRIASTYLAAAAEARIGGDLYASARTTDGTRLIIGDVRGKGLTSIGDAALLLCTFREASRRHITLPRLIEQLETSFRRNLEEFAETDAEADECFVTAAVVEVPDAEPVIHLIDRGHPPPLLFRGGRTMTLHGSRNDPPLGLSGLVSADDHVDTFSFEPGDILLLYTDGVLEARDRDGRFYPFAERVGAWNGQDPEDLVRYLRDDLLAHVHQRLDDDAALVAVERVAAGPGLGARWIAGEGAVTGSGVAGA